MISPNQAKDLFNLEQFRSDPYCADIREHLMRVSEDLSEADSPQRHAVNKLLNLLDRL